MSVGSLNNPTSLLSLRNYNLQQAAISRSLNRLATGRRINRGADDPAGLIASESLNATLAALDAQTSANERAMSIADTADAALGEVSDLLTHARTLVAANANSAGLSAEERAANQLEIDSILDSVDRIANTTTFNGQKLLDGSGSVAAWGSSVAIDPANTGSIGKSTIDGTDYALSSLHSGQSLDSTHDAAGNASAVLDKAINDVATTRGKVGAYAHNTLAANLNVIAAQQVNLSRSLSMIRDLDYGAESCALTRSSVLAKAGLLTGRLVSVLA